MELRLAAIAAVVGIVAFATPALADDDHWAELRTPGADQPMGCLAWESASSSSMACSAPWRWAKQVLIRDDGTRDAYRMDGPYAYANWAMLEVTELTCDLSGVQRIVWKVSDLDRKGGWEGRGSYRC